MSVSLSTHVLDTERGRPGSRRARRAAAAATSSSARGETDADGRARLAEELEPGRYRLAFEPPSPFFRRVELELELEDGHHHVPAARLVVRMRELPRQLSVEELAELFEGRTRLVERLAEREDPLGSAPTRSLAELSDERRSSRRSTRTRRSARERPVGALGRRAGRRRRPGDPDRARVPEPGLRGEVRLPLRRLRRTAGRRRRSSRCCAGGSSGRARRSSRPRCGELVAIARDRWRAASLALDPYANDWLDLLLRAGCT